MASTTKLPDHLKTRLHRVTDLFKVGRPVVLDDTDPDDPVVVWVQKLNSFQRADALRDADYGRAKRMAILTEATEEIQGIRLRLADYDDDQLINNILAPRSNEFWSAGRDDVTADKDWEDRIAAIRDYTDANADGSYVPEEETERLQAISTEYLAAVTEAMNKRTRDAVSQLKEKTRQEQEDEYILSYRRMKGAESWQDEYNRTELWYALRDCNPNAATHNSRHDQHLHPQLLENRAQLYELPDELVEQCQQVLRELNMSPADAGNSDAPRTSSASSEPQDTEEASTASTPQETSTSPAGTSSTPSTPESVSSAG